MRGATDPRAPRSKTIQTFVCRSQGAGGGGGGGRRIDRVQVQQSDILHEG